MEPFFLKVGELVLVNLVLSGDNALLIALAVTHLPSRQRRFAMWFGILAAMVLRAILTGGASEVIGLPFVRTLGSLLLVAIAFNLITAETISNLEHKRRTSFLSAIGAILLADATMSLDNVAALAGMVEGDFRLLFWGLIISLLVMVFASAGIGSLLERYPKLLFAGSAILAFTAGKLLAEDIGLKNWLGSNLWLAFVPAILMLAILAWKTKSPHQKQAG